MRQSGSSLMKINLSGQAAHHQEQKIACLQSIWLSSCQVSPKCIFFFGVCSEDDAMAPQIFEQGLRLNSYHYMELLNNMVKPWLERLASGRPSVWQNPGRIRNVCQIIFTTLSAPTSDHLTLLIVIPLIIIYGSHELHYRTVFSMHLSWYGWDSVW